MQATDSLDFGDEIRIEVETKICTDEGLPCKDVFDKSRYLAANILQQVYFLIYFLDVQFLAIDSYLC